MLLLLISGCRRENKEVTRLGYIAGVKNSVYYKNFKSLVWEDAREKGHLFRGDYIRTGSGSLAILKIKDEIINVEENTLVKIEERGSNLPEKVEVELVLLNGDITVEQTESTMPSISVVRIKDGKRQIEDVSRLIKKTVRVPDLADVGNKPIKVGLIYPCNDEVVTIRNPVIRWDSDITGVLRIYDSDENVNEYRLYGERSRRVELDDGKYQWELYSRENGISDRCSFFIKMKMDSMKAVNISKDRRTGKKIVDYFQKNEEKVPEEMKTKKSDSDFAKQRLMHIQTVISKSIDDIKNAKKSIDTTRIKNYAELYRKLDELNSLLIELKVLQESLLIEIMKIESPSLIAGYLNELSEIEDNLKDINHEIRAIETTINQEKEKE